MLLSLLITSVNNRFVYIVSERQYCVQECAAAVKKIFGSILAFIENAHIREINAACLVKYGNGIHTQIENFLVTNIQYSIMVSVNSPIVEICVSFGDTNYSPSCLGGTVTWLLCRPGGWCKL